MRDRWARARGLRWTRAVSWLRAPGLAGRLTAAAMLGVTVAAVAGGVAGAALLRGCLLGQARQEVRVYASALLAGPVVNEPVFGGPALGGQTANGISVEIAGLGGQPLAQSTGGAAPPPLVSAPGWIARHTGRLVTVRGADGRGSWLVLAEAIHYTAHHVMYVYGPEDYSLVISARRLPGLPGTVVVAASLAGIGRATSRLVAADARLAGTVLLLLAGAGAVALRSALRPLAATGKAAVPATDGGVPGRAPLTGQEAEETMRQALADTAAAIARSLTVIQGFSDHYRSGQLTAAGLDRMMGRVAAEADRMAGAAERLAQAAR